MSTPAESQRQSAKTQPSALAGLSASSQDYLKAVWSLQEWEPTAVTAKSLSEAVGVRLSTASDAIRKLRKQGYLDHAPYGEVTLTEQGRAAALSMVRRHRLIETFLVEVLNLRWDQVHVEAENLEHSVSDFLVDRIDEHLGRPAQDPHGDPIPDASGSIVFPDAIPLQRLSAGDIGTVVRISDHNPDLLQFFSERGLVIGARVELAKQEPFAESQRVRVLGAEDATAFPLGERALGAVWVAED